MWSCPDCNRTFKQNNQQHHCNNKGFNDFLTGKSPAMVALFYELISKFEEIGPIQLNTTKTMIVISNQTAKIAYVLTIGKQFIDIVFSFKQPYDDNFCFRRIALVPKSSDYNITCG